MDKIPERMKYMGLYGVSFVVSGVGALEHILSHINLKAAVIQESLSRSSELTREAYRLALSAAEEGAWWRPL